MNPVARQLKLIEADVRRIRDHAAYVFTLNPNGKSFSLASNQGARLNVVAVIGPSIFEGSEIREAVLLEVGIGRTRPYSRSQGKNNGQKLSEIPRRRKCFSLSPKQYRFIAPALFGLLSKIAADKVAAWETPPFFRAEIESFWFSTRRKRTLANPRTRAYPRGVWFTVLREDAFLASDLLWAERQNKILNRILDGLVGFIGKRLSPYLGKRRRRGVKLKHGGRGKPRTVSGWTGKKSFDKLVGVRECQEAVARAKLPDYLRRALATKFNARNLGHPLLCLIISDIICPPPEKTKEERLLETALLPGPRGRIPRNLQVAMFKRLTPQGNSRLIFELFPFATPEAWAEYKEKMRENNPDYSEVPF